MAVDIADAIAVAEKRLPNEYAFRAYVSGRGIGLIELRVTGPSGDLASFTTVEPTASAEHVCFVLTELIAAAQADADAQEWVAEFTKHARMHTTRCAEPGIRCHHART